jgi:hypothetical protein
MGMGLEGRGKVRWIRSLIVILALTASRANFPLVKSSPDSTTGTALAVSVTKSRKKADHAAPSRRLAESRRLDWVRTLSLVSETSPSLRALLASWNVGLRAPTVRPTFESCVTSTRPEYLQSHLPSTASSSLPPPA